MEETKPLFMSRVQVARMLGVGAHTVDRSGIPRTKLAENGRVLFRRSDVLAYMKMNMQGTPVPEELAGEFEKQAASPEKKDCGTCALYGPSEKLADGLMFGSIVTEVFYHNGKVTKVTRQRKENYLDKPEGV